MIPGYCSQGCTNTVGSFTCICAKGYSLVNGTTCVVQGSEPIMIFSDGDSIRGLYMKSNRYFPIHPAVNWIHGIDMSNDQRVFWIDSGEDRNGIYRCNLDGSDKREIVTAGLKGPEDVALDWVAGNLYITDSELKKIIVCKKDGTICSVLFDRIDRPRALALDSIHGYMFWTQWGKSAGIYLAGLDASGKETLVNMNIEWPNGLTFDTIKSRVYWCDAKLDKIEYYDMVNKSRHLLLEDNIFHPYSISVFEDKIYWSDWITYSLDVANKFTGKNQTTLLREVGKNFISIHVFHPVNYPHHVISPCWSNKCSHLCLISPRKQYTCACPDHMVLESNGFTCEFVVMPSVLIGLERNVKKMYTETIGNNIFLDISMPTHLSIGDFTFDSVNNIMYLFDMDKHYILSINLENLRTKTIIDPYLDDVCGLNFDYNNNNLYWLEKKIGRLEIISVETKTRVKLIENLERPNDLVLDPLRKSLYIANLGSEPYILRADMNGYNQEKIVSGCNIGLPVSLFLIENQLFWADAKFGTIESLMLKTTTIKSAKRRIIRNNLGYVMSFGVMNDTLYWTDMDNGYLYHSPLWDKSSKPTQIPFPESVHGISTVKKIQIVGHEFNLEVRCAVNCSHLCLLGMLKNHLSIND